MGALPESFDTSNYINANENNSIAKKNSIYASGNSKDTNGNGNHIAFGIPHMQQLFEEQRKYLNYFFSHVEYAEVQAFAQVLMDAKGVIFFTGVGKSGFVAQKITQTFVSTGTKAVFLSPTDALHGDIGIVGSNDVLVLFSKSGTTEELLRLVPCARAKGAYLVGITNLKNSQLGNACDMHVHLPLERELCPFDLAPVTSTAIQMLFGDTVAIFLMQAKNMTRDQYALNHPAGRIGKRLIFRVQDVMKRQDELPLCKENDLIMDQLVELTSKGCGCLLVVDDEDHLLGTFTDGDLRRTLKSVREGVFKITVGQMCNRNPRSIGPNAMAVEAMQKMESPPSPVQFLPVVDHNNVVIGIVTLHGLVSAGL
ncbi:probable arabinose 5-phosphate isomerase [Cryptomeria japonica]|uniref:probable arabinose 5-phosphate isomerase n=1 Tax=Cryptomeria japonica TaxID=3369 RepID=UPI0027D9D9D1|nr:probable arabinose 5-phosphate isomerase [Cryptomeria japonica]